MVAQMPGRESRLRERPLTSIDEMVRELLPEIDAQTALPLAIVGHSMGGLVGFELAHALRNAGLSGPTHLFVSGSPPPSRQDDGLPSMHTMSDDDLVAEIDRRYGGIPATVRQERELLELLLPMLRGDVTALETYQYRERPPLACPITAYAGTRDARATPEGVKGWREESTGAFASRAFEGDHFFVHQHRETILPEVLRALEHSIVRQGAA
jgi:surfactin synthase thioesterase subunit